MLEFESLRIADAYEWLGTGGSAGEYLSISQSTVSRSIKRFKALTDQLQEFNSMELLEMERVIHQRWRFHQGQDLRLHAFRWTNHLIAKHPLAQWRVNPVEVSVTKRATLDLLEQRVIDAVCAPYPLIATADKGIFACLPLYRSCLQVMTEDASIIAQERSLRRGDIASITTLGTLEFVPPEAARCSFDLDAKQFGITIRSKISTPMPARYWGIPLTPLAAPHLSPLDYETSIPYEEYLVVRKEWAGHPHVSALRQSLIQAMQTAIGNGDCAGMIDFAA